MPSFMMNYSVLKFPAWRLREIHECLLYLQDDPMAFPSGQIQGLFSYNLLALTQRHIVEVVVVKCVAHLLP